MLEDKDHRYTVNPKFNLQPFIYNWIVLYLKFSLHNLKEVIDVNSLHCYCEKSESFSIITKGIIAGMNHFDVADIWGTQQSDLIRNAKYITSNVQTVFR